jgi:hypothetical protein
MMKRWGSVIGIVLLAGALVTAGPAQEILGELAEASRSQRMTSGVASIAIGAAVAVGGSILLAEQGMSSYALLAGGLIALPGVLSVAIPSDAERMCARACHSEVAAADALEEMALRARISRYVSGATRVVAGTLSLLFPYRRVTQFDYLYSAVASFGSAASDFLILSREERAYRRYLRQIEDG